jgi:periplasmic divalent cation tolerance protein
MLQELALIYTTFISKKEALDFCHKVMNLKMAFCANVIENGTSVYLWKGKIEQSEESYVLLKTTKDLLPLLEEWILENHPYKTPAIIKIQDVQASKSFLEYANTEIGHNYSV